MTAQPTDRDWDRLDALVDEDPLALRDAAWRLTTALAAAEHRIARLEAQTQIRGRAVIMYRERAREAEARIADALALCDEWEAFGTRSMNIGAVRRALESVPQPRA